MLPTVGAVETSENDGLRSNFVSELIQQKTERKIVDCNKTLIPKVIVQFWDKSDAIPYDVSKCINTWKTREIEGFQHLLFDEISAMEFISTKLGSVYVDAYNACYHPAMKSDYFRLCYIYVNGGMYVDVDDIDCQEDITHLFSDHRLKLQPLCYDIKSDSMIEPKLFTQKDTFSDKWIYYFNNNPIISAPDNPIVGYALNRATKILQKSDSEFPEIQSTAGPGNLTASVVAFLFDKKFSSTSDYISIQSDWNSIACTVWQLSYRNDKRNWRLANGMAFNKTTKDKEQS
ncbi:glycosyltransferase family 32 protein [Photobacterium leiognathi]|uniref:glycosyltransferase family 32 protein n=1 Tax=Photobacterium leiognathi TaxID=553611 RepID=UPI002981620B|nr:glycosyltransferase [Photobacterium leiognathi]